MQLLCIVDVVLVSLISVENTDIAITLYSLLSSLPWFGHNSYWLSVQVVCCVMH